MPPAFANMGGFKMPILTAFTFGNVVGRFSAGSVRTIRSLQDFEARSSGRLSGETIVTEMWREHSRVLVRARPRSAASG